jgi:hypothetical protein
LSNAVEPWGGQVVKAAAHVSCRIEAGGVGGLVRHRVTDDDSDSATRLTSVCPYLVQTATGVWNGDSTIWLAM